MKMMQKWGRILSVINHVLFAITLIASKCQKRKFSCLQWVTLLSLVVTDSIKIGELLSARCKKCKNKKATAE